MKTWDTTGFSRVEFQFQPNFGGYDPKDTSGFSRVVFQFQPTVRLMKKAETEPPHD